MDKEKILKKCSVELFSVLAWKQMGSIFTEGGYSHWKEVAFEFSVGEEDFKPSGVAAL